MNIITTYENKNVIDNSKNSTDNLIFVSENQLETILNTIFHTDQIKFSKEETSTKSENNDEFFDLEDVSIVNKDNKPVVVNEEKTITEPKRTRKRSDLKEKLFAEFDKNLLTDKEIAKKCNVCNVTVAKYYKQYQEEKKKQVLLDNIEQGIVKKYNLTEQDFKVYDFVLPDETIEKTWHLKGLDPEINIMCRDILSQNNIKPLHFKIYCTIEKIIQDMLINNIQDITIFRQMLVINEIYFGDEIIKALWEKVYLKIRKQNLQIINEQMKYKD